MVTCEVVAVQEIGIEVKLAEGEITAFIKRSDLSRDRSEQRPDRFNVGDKVDAAVMSVDKAARRVSVSVKALEIAEEKQAVAQYGSSDSGASLGDIFKAAIKKRDTSDTADAGGADSEDADISEPEAGQPTGAEPQDAEPESGEPKATKLEAAEPKASQPEPAKVAGEDAATKVEASDKGSSKAKPKRKSPTKSTSKSKPKSKSEE